MTADDRFDHTVSNWLELEGRGAAPSWLHSVSMAKAAQTRQRPGWTASLASSLGDGGMGLGRRNALRIAAVLALVALLAAAVVAIGTRRDSVVTIRNGAILVARQSGQGKAEYLTVTSTGQPGRELFQASDCGQCAFWSPDGAQVMFPEDSNGRLTTAIVRSDGAAKLVLQPLPDTTVNLGPGAWSPDGKTIALTGWDEADPSLRGIYLASPDGGSLRQLTQSSDGRGHDWPAFSPDGTKLLYIAIDGEAPPGGGLAGDLFVTSIDGTEQRQVNPPGTKVIATTKVGRPMDWSPDGATIILAAIDDSFDDSKTGVWIAGADGADARQITGPASRMLSVDWAPAGQTVLSGDVQGGRDRILLVDPRSGAVQVIWTGGVADPACCGTWSPDASLILFERGPTGLRDLWTMRPNGDVVARITHTPADYVWYSWAPAPVP